MVIVMRSYLNSLLEECAYPEGAKIELLYAYDRIVASSADALSVLLAEYDVSYNIDYEAALARMNEISDRSGVHEYTGALLLYLCYSRRLREYYYEAGIGDSVFLDTVLDLRYKLDECSLVKGVVGTFVAKWFSGFFKLERFALGRLQFEIIPFGAQYETQGIALTHDTPVINVHSPRSGARLDRDSVLESYRLAYEFYKPELGKTIAFVCSSWLLFPRNKELLKPGSNLLEFIGDFDIFASGEYDGYGEVWRLFDKDYDGNPNHMPADSSLRRAYIDLMKRGERTGWGRGVFIFSPEK